MWNLVWVPSMQCKDLEQCHSEWSQRCVESDECAMGARTQEECTLSLKIEKKGFDVMFQDG
jgi:hypothetical protein